MPVLFRSTLLLSGLLLFASAGSAQTTIDMATSAGTCSYTTPGSVAANPANGHLTASQSGTLSGTGCPTASQVPAVTFGPAATLSASPTSLSGGTSIGTTFALQPLYATSCTGSISTTAGSGTGSFTGGNTLCNSVAACATSTPLSIPATFTNTSTTAASTYKVSVTCSAATGASPATTTSNVVTISQAAQSSGGTPSANFTFTTSGLTATFTDASTDSGGTIGSYSWNFGDTNVSGGGTSTAKNPAYTYSAAGTYSVTETVTDSGNGSQSSKTQSVTVTSSGSCPMITSSTSGITNFTQWTGNQNVYYYGASGGTKSVSVTSFTSYYQKAWPGTYGVIAQASLPTNKYISLAFAVPAGFLPATGTMYGDYTVGETSYSAPITMTISTSCGDFSNPATNPASTVVPGCYHNLTSSDGILQWRNNSTCILSNSSAYFLNIINADTTNVTPGGGTAASSANSKCSTVCTDPIQNGPGTW